ncbi:hypothetical protein [Caldisericum sp.]|uniref:hypothetical protein n=1 Tax=Caldisericum sp. TaxID=2499687 RepID=UPI003D14DF5C
MNTRKKGKFWEKVVARFWIKFFGATCIDIARSVKFQDNDFFSMFDIIAFVPINSHHWIQVTCKDMKAKKKKILNNFPYWDNQFLALYDDKNNMLTIERRYKDCWAHILDFEATEIVNEIKKKKTTK